VGYEPGPVLLLLRLLLLILFPILLLLLLLLVPRAAAVADHELPTRYYGSCRAVAFRMTTGRSGSTSGASNLPAVIFSATSSPCVTRPTTV
jgi:hypothetical protein